MAAWLSALFSLVVPDSDSTTRRDEAQVRAAVARLPYRWTVARRVDRSAVKGTARRHLVAEMHGAVAMPAFRLDRHGHDVVLSEHDDTGAWMLGRFADTDEALAALRRAALARFVGAVPEPEHAAAPFPQSSCTRKDDCGLPPVTDSPPVHRAYHRPPPVLRLRPALTADRL